jgi:hypothetical protein
MAEGYRDARYRLPIFVQNRDLAHMNVHDFAEFDQPVGVRLRGHIVLHGPKKVFEPRQILGLTVFVENDQTIGRLGFRLRLWLRFWFRLWLRFWFRLWL